MKLECDLRGIKKAGSKAKTLGLIRAHHEALPSTVAAAKVEMKGGNKKRKRETPETIVEQNAKRLKLKPTTQTSGSKAAVHSGKRMVPVKLEKPMEGSPILEVHQKYPYPHKNPQIYVSEDGKDVFNATMTEVSLNTGMNRFYVVQLLKVGQKFDIFCHWGRTGSKHAEWDYSDSRSDFKVYSYTSKERGIEEFKKWFGKKTGNAWDHRYDFRQKPGFYHWGELSRKNKKTIEHNLSNLKGESVAHSNLPTEIQALVDLIFDEDTILGSMKESGVKIEEMPLGAVTVERIQKGSNTLSEIRALLETKGERQAASELLDERVFRSRLQMLSTEFYNLIPSLNPVIIDDKELLKQKSDLVNLLSDIAIGQNLIKGNPTAPVSEHPTDTKFKSLACNMKVVPKDTDVFRHIQTYFNNTARAPKGACLCGSRYGKVPRILEIFEIERKGEHERLATHAHLDNRKLLWHGTNIAVVAAILSTGLRIMGNAGGRVGRGLYFAAENNKSVYYVSAAEKCGTGIMFLAEVAMGKEFPIVEESPWLRMAPPGYNSVVAQGIYDPDPNGNVYFKLNGKNVLVPTGKPKKRPQYAKSSFTQSEYLVYKESQVQLRYMLKLEMK